MPKIAITTADLDRKYRQCVGKFNHQTLDAAVEAAREASKRSFKPMDAYHCPWCDGFHIGGSIKCPS